MCISSRSMEQTGAEGLKALPEVELLGGQSAAGALDIPGFLCLRWLRFLH